MLTFGQFGAGRIGRMHARNLAASPRAELSAIYDLDAAASKAAAEETGAAPAPTIDAVLGDTSIDAVLIASSTDTHCDLIERAVRAGKAVICEKPIHLDIRRVDACREVVAESGVPVCRSDSTAASIRATRRCARRRCKATSGGWSRL